MRGKELCWFLLSTREKVTRKLTFVFYSDYLIVHTNCCLLCDGTPTTRLEGNICVLVLEPKHRRHIHFMVILGIIQGKRA